MHQYSMYYLLAINIVSFFLYGIDKYKAKKNNRRQAESNIKLALNIAEARRRKTKSTCHWLLLPGMLFQVASHICWQGTDQGRTGICCCRIDGMD